MSSTVMKKRLARRGDEIVLVLDESLLAELGLDENSVVEMSIEENGFFVSHSGLSADERRFRESAEKIAGKHAGLFRRLAN
jgi:antitoxin component of MazEF toxin-antitoxin module